MLKRSFLFIVLMFIGTMAGYAQCAMCRTTIVNNVSHGETAVAASLNTGILYLFFTPYILVGVIAFFWYRKSKINDKELSIIRRFKR